MSKRSSNWELFAHENDALIARPQLHNFTHDSSVENLQYFFSQASLYSITVFAAFFKLEFETTLKVENFAVFADLGVNREI